MYFNGDIWNDNAYLNISYINDASKVIIKNIDLYTQFDKDYINYDDD